MRAFILSAGLALPLTQVALAEEKEDLTSANFILPGCRSFLVEEKDQQSDIAWYKMGECLGIILGLADAANLQKPRPLCVPDGVTNEQMVRVVVNYIDRHPETMHLRFSHLALHALLDVWPCNR